ncbi:MAG: class I SAM-dependent RNA methyltransferase [Candidatus Gracilibacteria bacterium]|nr:class I SAM-dependent RNA methyltransferase [Candidatus Gracilibacteria bacterium]
MKYLLTTSAGIEAIAKNEIMKQGGNILEVKDRLVFFEGEIDLIVKINLWSRVGNKLYLVLNEAENVDNFDKLYDLVYAVNWKNYINRYYPVITKATSIKSDLISTPAIQKITKKAIVDKMTNKSGKIMPEENDKPIFEVFSFFIENKAYILLNTSGETLYKRGYRADSGEAPIKESLAATLVILSNWKFSENFYDITCGSGTIAIEAVMFARNIAPGLNRYFSFENWDFVPAGLLEKEKKLASEKIFDKIYNVIASDIDDKVLEIAKKNAKNAGVLDSITFINKNLRDYKHEKISGTLVSNPPYGLRLKDDDLKGIYKDINIILDKNKDLKGGIITSYSEFDNIINSSKFKKRKLYNGNEMCYFYMKK